MMDLGAMVGGGGDSEQAFGSAYGLLADVATTLCPADILSLVRNEIILIDVLSPFSSRTAGCSWRFV